ncbi:MAG: Rrf2 family transcriptional regulator [Methylococcales bacterium]
MRISNYTDYGLRVLMYLSSLKSEDLSSISEVSKIYNLSQNHVTKVVNQLGRLGYIITIRGKGGGIKLAKAANKIRIGQVIRELEKHCDGVDCDSSNCDLKPCCKLKIAILNAMDSFFQTMDKYVISDFTEDNPYYINLSTTWDKNNK